MPIHSRTMRWTMSTEATPAAAWGRSIDQVLKPKIRADSAMTHSEAGGLSTVMKLPLSIEP